MVDFQAAGSTGTKILGIFCLCVCVSFACSQKGLGKQGRTWPRRRRAWKSSNRSSSRLF